MTIITDPYCSYGLSTAVVAASLGAIGDDLAAVGDSLRSVVVVTVVTLTEGVVVATAAATTFIVVAKYDVKFHTVAIALVRAVLPDFLVRAVLPDCLVRAALPDCLIRAVIHASLVQVVIPTSLIWAVISAVLAQAVIPACLIRAVITASLVQPVIPAALADATAFPAPVRICPNTLYRATRRSDVDVVASSVDHFVGFNALGSVFAGPDVFVTQIAAFATTVITAGVFFDGLDGTAAIFVRVSAIVGRDKVFAVADVGRSVAFAALVDVVAVAVGEPYICSILRRLCLKINSGLRIYNTRSC
jgi:hypothetical protein